MTRSENPAPPSTSVDRRKALIVGLVLAAIVIAFVVYAVAWNKKNPEGKAACMALYDARVGHDPSDNAFWAGLVDCANKGLLPPGQNNPGAYSN